MQTTLSRVTRLDGPAPMPAGAYDLADLGYVEEEFLLEGVAASYALVGDRSADGKWRASAGAETPFVSRLVVRRPTDPSRFSGTVAVEWNNVSGGVDASPDWTLLHRQLIRAGHAFVGVTAQKAGIDGGGLVEGPHLKKTHPDRYNALNHPGDAWSFDIYSQAGAVLRRPDGPLGALAARQLIGVGESQLAMYLVSYINAVDALARVYDAFFVHGRGAAGASFDGVRFRPSSGDPGARMRDVPAEQIRDDARVPVLVLQSETDVTMLGGGRCKQPDGAAAAPVGDRRSGACRHLPPCRGRPGRRPPLVRAARRVAQAHARPDVRADREPHQRRAAAALHRPGRPGGALPVG